MLKFIVAITIMLFCTQIDTKGNYNLDSIGIENYKGKKIILHKVEKKETYYSIGRKYTISPKLIIDFNKSIALQPGIVIKVPTEINYVEAQKITSHTKKTFKDVNIVEYTVRPKDNLILISNTFNLPIDKIKAFNHLKTNELTVGQVLKIPSFTSNKIYVKDTMLTNHPKKNALVLMDSLKDEKTDTATLTINRKNKKSGRNYGLSEIEEKGIAVWLSDASFNSDKMFVLHRTLPIGTVIKITNPMTSTSAFVKVVGKFSENESNKDAIVIVTKAVADALNVQDKRFFCRLTYAMTKNE